MRIEDVPHSGGSVPHASASDCARCGMERVSEQVIDLWNRLNGWIPGGAYEELAETLGVSVDRLVHYDSQSRHRVGPPDHLYNGQQIRGNEMSLCVMWVNGQPCGKTSEEHRHA